MNINPLSYLSQSHSSMSIADIAGSTSLNVQQGVATRRLKSWDSSYVDKTRKIGSSIVPTMSQSRLLPISLHTRYYPSGDIENAIPRILPMYRCRSLTLIAPRASRRLKICDAFRQ